MGRPRGAKNNPNHKAGGKRRNSGRKLPTQSNTLFNYVPGPRGAEESKSNQDASSDDESVPVVNNISASSESTSIRAAQANLRRVELEKRKKDSLNELRKVSKECRNNSSEMEDEDDIVLDNDDVVEENADVSDSEINPEKNDDLTGKFKYQTSSFHHFQR